MIRVHRIESLDVPALDPYRTLRQSAEQWRSGIFVADGEKIVRRMLETRIETISALLTDEWLQLLKTQLEEAPEVIDVYVAPKAELEKLTGFSLFQGVLAVGRIPPAPSIDELVAQSAVPRLLVALDGLANSENIGVVIRNAAALGAHGLICGPTCASPWLRRAVRNSMGAVFRLPIKEVDDLPAALTDLHTHSIRCIAAHPHTEQSELDETDLKSDCCLVFGSESQGLSAPVLSACDTATSIPMLRGVSSLNVASASAAFLYEAARQRRSARLH